MQDKPLVSILVPAYNHGRYIKDCLESIISQDYPSIELLIVDDGSTDNTLQVIEEHLPRCENRFERVVVEKQRNCGCAASCKRLCQMMKGEFFSVIASDDQYMPGAISAMVSAMAEDDSLGVVVGVNEIMDSNGQRCFWDRKRRIVYQECDARYLTFDEYCFHNLKIDPNSPEFGSYNQLVKGNHIPNGSLRRASVAKRVIPYTEKAPLEDWWFHLQVSKIARYKHINAKTFRYRWHATNTIKNGRKVSEMVGKTLKEEARQLLESGDCNMIDAFSKVVLEDLPLFHIPKLIYISRKKMLYSEYVEVKILKYFKFKLMRAHK